LSLAGSAAAGIGPAAAPGLRTGADAADPAHLRCCAARDTALEAGHALVTSDFVAGETLTLLRFRLGLAAADRWWRQMDQSARLRWERVDSDRFENTRAHTRALTGPGR